MLVEERQIIFFDGHCNLCNGFIDFVVRRDKGRRLYIASIQGRLGEKVLSIADRKNLSSVVFKDSQGRFFYKSRAVLRVMSELGGLYTVLGIFSLLPRFLTDWVYDIIASRRYRWFGRSETCRIPTDEERAHFLD